MSAHYAVNDDFSYVYMFYVDDKSNKLAINKKYYASANSNQQPATDIQEAQSTNWEPSKNKLNSQRPASKK